MFMWSYNIISSRCFGYYLPSSVILLPLAEYLNHANNPSVTYYTLHNQYEDSYHQKYSNHKDEDEENKRVVNGYSIKRDIIYKGEEEKGRWIDDKMRVSKFIEHA